MASSEDQIDVNNILAADLPVAVSSLTDIKNVVSQVNQMIENILTRLRNNEFQTKDGLSFLDVKNNLLLSYLINLGHCALRKVSGESIHGEKCIDRLVETRTILERMRPVEHKLKYQIEKYLKLAASEKYDESDPLQFKANPNNLVVEEEESSGTDDEAKEKKKAGIYVPPKIMPMSYDEENAQERKSVEKAKRHALSASAIQNLKEEYMDAPVEINELSANGLQRANVARERQERQEYEETYFTRLPTTKEDRHRLRQKYSSKSFANELVGMGSSRTDSSGKRKGDNKGKKKGFKKRRKF